MTFSIMEFFFTFLNSFYISYFILLIIITTCTFICNKDVG